MVETPQYISLLEREREETHRQTGKERDRQTGKEKGVRIVNKYFAKVVKTRKPNNTRV